MQTTERVQKASLMGIRATSAEEAGAKLPPSTGDSIGRGRRYAKRLRPRLHDRVSLGCVGKRAWIPSRARCKRRKRNRMRRALRGNRRKTREGSTQRDRHQENEDEREDGRRGPQTRRKHTPNHEGRRAEGGMVPAGDPAREKWQAGPMRPVAPATLATSAGVKRDGNLKWAPGRGYDVFGMRLAL